MSAVLKRASEVLPQMLAEEKARRAASSDERLFSDEALDELTQVSTDPSRHARLFDHAPVAFDPAKHAPTAPQPPPEQPAPRLFDDG